MEQPSRRVFFLALAAAMLAAGGATISRLFRRAPGDRSLAAGIPPATPAATATAQELAAPPAARGYLRRLVTIEPPMPGQPPAVRRDADVAAETAVSPQPELAGGPGAMGADIETDRTSASVSAGAPQAPNAGSSSAGGGAPARAEGSRNQGSPGAVPAASALFAAAPEAARIAAGARARRASFAAAPAYAPLTSQAVASALRAQIGQDERADDSVRDALSTLGPGASFEEQAAAVADALSAAGEPDDPESVSEAIARAQQPASAAPTPQALDGAIAQASSNLPTPQRMDQLAQLAAQPEPPPPSAPPPRGGVQAYIAYRAAFDKVEQDYHLDPSKILPFPAIESSNGKNTGKFPLRDTLLSIADDPKGRFKPGQRAQAGRDLVAMTDLEASGDLGGRKIDQLYGSNMGAIGVTQFLPTSWAAYGRSMTGGKRDPWNFSDAVLSTGNFLYRHGAVQDFDRAILSYNRSEAYRESIRQYQANVAPGVQAVRESSP